MNRKATAAGILAAIALIGGAKASRVPDCWHNVTTLAGSQLADPGEFNRFPAAEAVGAECEPVPCEVMAGEDADVDAVDAGPAFDCVRRPPSLIERYRHSAAREAMP